MKFEPSDWRAAGLAVYWFAGLNTFGYRWNHSSATAADIGADGRTVEAAAVALIWPIYWPCKLAIKLWEPPAPVTPAITDWHNRLFIAYGKEYAKVTLSLPDGGAAVRLFPLPEPAFNLIPLPKAGDGDMATIFPGGSLVYKTNHPWAGGVYTNSTLIGRPGIYTNTVTK